MAGNSRDNNEDFGKILDRWETSGSPDTPLPRQRHASPSPRQRPAGGVDKASMESWLEAYPPEDKDNAEVSSDTSPKRRNPEKMKVDDTIDLHGYRLDEALHVTGSFIDRSVAAGFRKVVIVHGKGDNGQGILRREVRAYLEHHPMTGTMGYNRGAEGGRGALWVILRQRSGPQSD